MELKQYFSVIWKWLWLIVLSTVIAAGVSYYATSSQPKVYAASVKMLVGQSIQSPNPNSGDIFTSQQLALTYIQIAKTAPVLQSTIDALGLKMSPDQLNARSNASIIQNTQLIELSVVDTDPARAQALANELAHQLTMQGPASTDADQSKRRDFALKQADDLQRKIEEGQQTIASLQSSIQVTASAREIADKQQQINTLQAQITQWQQGYLGLMTFLAPKSPNVLSIVEPASLPQFPIGPNVGMNTLVAASIGLLLAVVGVLLIEYLDDSLKSPEEVTRSLHLPTIGSIARIGGGEDEKLVAALAPRSSITEAYRVLRTNIQFSSVDRPVKAILVTSPGPTEGKSLMAANLAVVMAQAGLRTILVDGDLRKPSLHRLFGVSNDAGLTNGLIQQSALDGFVRRTGVENLRIITTGALPPNPAEVLGSERMRALKTQLESQTDVIILDSPPCLPLTDAAILARLVDGVILVVDCSRTRRELALRAKELIENVGGRILGVVLNRITPRGSGYYQYYYQYYAPNGRHNGKQDSHPNKGASVLPKWVKALTRR
jgi:succinoglycan biosynthesis transport protein ExoP